MLLHPLHLVFLYKTALPSVRMLYPVSIRIYPFTRRLYLLFGLLYALFVCCTTFLYSLFLLYSLLGLVYLLYLLLYPL